MTLKLKQMMYNFGEDDDVTFISVASSYVPRNLK